MLCASLTPRRHTRGEPCADYAPQTATLTTKELRRACEWEILKNQQKPVGTQALDAKVRRSGPGTFAGADRSCGPLGQSQSCTSRTYQHLRPEVLTTGGAGCSSATREMPYPSTCQ